MTPELKAKLAKLKAVAEAMNTEGGGIPFENYESFEITFNPQTVLALLAAIETMAEALEFYGSGRIEIINRIPGYVSREAQEKVERLLNGI